MKTTGIVKRIIGPVVDVDFGENIPDIYSALEVMKDNKKIILSHSKLFQDVVAAEKVKEVAQKETAEQTTKRAVKKLKDNIERSTLGDLEALINLKSDMEKSEKASVKAEKEPAKAHKAHKAVEVPVTTGRQFNAYIEIISGISDGDKVIDNITDKISNGTKVKVL